MDCRTGEIASQEHFAKKLNPKEMAMYVKPVNERNLSIKTQEQLAKTGRAWISRNSKCPCGSGKRFKRCCMFKP